MGVERSGDAINHSIGIRDHLFDLKYHSFQGDKFITIGQPFFVDWDFTAADSPEGERKIWRI
jgi:hypothetical protein